MSKRLNISLSRFIRSLLHKSTTITRLLIAAQVPLAVLTVFEVRDVVTNTDYTRVITNVFKNYRTTKTMIDTVPPLAAFEAAGTAMTHWLSIRKPGATDCPRINLAA